MPTVEQHNEREIWKSPPSLNKWWVEVSNLGRVRTLPHKSKFTLRGQQIERKEPGRIRKASRDTRGRFQVFLHDEVSSKAFFIHRLVAECFVKNQNPEKYNYVFFKNGDISDCRAENLQWGDENDKAWLREGKHIKNLIRIYDNGVLVGEYFGLGETARALGCSKQAIHSAMGRGGMCKGFSVKGVKRGRKQPSPKTIDEGRNKRNCEFNSTKFPDCLFSD